MNEGLYFTDPNESIWALKPAKDALTILQEERRKESMDEINAPYGLGGAIFPPQDTATQEHEHMFCFAIGEHGAIRGCELCGKAWILPRTDIFGWTTFWKEVDE